MLKPAASAIFMSEMVMNVTVILKKRFNNLSVEDMMLISTDIASKAHDAMMRAILNNKEDKSE